MKHEPIYDWMDYAAKKLKERLKPDIDIDDWMWGETCFRFVLILNASSRERAVVTDPYSFYYSAYDEKEFGETPYQQIDNWIEDRLYQFLRR